MKGFKEQCDLDPGEADNHWQLNKAAYLCAPSFALSVCFRLLSAALLLNDDFECCLPVADIIVGEALDSVVPVVPLIIVVAIMERGFPPSATI